MVVTRSSRRGGVSSTVARDGESMSLASYAGGLLVGVAMISFLHQAPFGICLASYCATLALVRVVAWSRAREITRNRPAARSATLGLLQGPSDA